MKRFFLFLSVLIFFGSCQNQSLLDEKFNLDIYNNMISLKLYNSDEIDQHDWFLLNYTIKRQRDYFGYDVVDKTYREILEMGKEFKANGLPVKTTFNYNGQQEVLTQVIKDVDLGMIRKKGKRKSMKRVLNFSCRYTNTSNKAMALQTSTFQLFGPFKDHITSLGYESNCLIKPQETITVNYIVDAKPLMNNLRYEEVHYLKSMGLEDFLYSIEVRPSGNTLAANPSTYSKCKFGSARIDHFKLFNYFADVELDKCVRKNADGQVEEFHLGDAHYIMNDAQEVQNMDRIGKGFSQK